MTTKPPECWASDPNARALRIELGNQRSLLLAFDQFAYAEMTLTDREQEIRAVFGTHEVRIRGAALRRLIAALQRMELGFIAPLSASALTQVPDGQPAIRDITVTEVQDPDAATPGHQAA